jgi:hypothetical protein
MLQILIGMCVMAAKGGLSEREEQYTVLCERLCECGSAKRAAPLPSLVPQRAVALKWALTGWVLQQGCVQVCA